MRREHETGRPGAPIPGGRKARARGGWRPVLILLGSNLLGAVVGGLFFVTAAFGLSLEDMGRYTLVVSLHWVGVGLVGSGLSVATLRLAADRLRHEDGDGAAAVVRQAFRVAAIVALLAALLGLAAGPLLAWEAGGALLALTALWAGARSAIDTVRSGLLARHAYGAVGLLVTATAFTGLIALGALLTAGGPTLRGLLLAHVGGLGAGAGLAWWRFAAPARRARSRLRALLGYARWPSLSEGTRLAQIHLGPAILIALVGEAEAGLFGVGRYPVYVFDIVTVSFYQFWLSKAVRPDPGASLRLFVVRQLAVAAVIGAGGVAVAVLARPLFERVGGAFADAAFLLPWNALDFAILLLVRPIESVYHGAHAPHLELVQRLVVLPLLLVLALLLVPGRGALGMVWAHLGAGIGTLALAGWLLQRALGAAERPAEAPA